ncbi:VOC family protein [Peribacillus sp. NPDC006672]|uniref:VOC family protein n=1 Tax=Peribacillus sp. NPDC006672 TaxID=3390606 RepID=UPI003CFDAAEC
MIFRLELFVHNLNVSKEFYKNLGLSLIYESEERVNFEGDNIVIMLAPDHTLHDNHHFKREGYSNKGIGVELILLCENIEKIYENFISLYPSSIESKLKKQEWGLVDFRVMDPDGYYFRISTGK